MDEKKGPDKVKEADESSYDAVVIGAGVGGLVCGALLAKEGLKVLIIERQERPGGYMTAYNRKGYSFQVPSVVGGFGPDGALTRITDHLGLRLDLKKIEPFQRCLYPDHDIGMPSDPTESLEILKDYFQPQTANLKKYFNTVESIFSELDVGLIRRQTRGRTALRNVGLHLRRPKYATYFWRGLTFQRMLDEHFTDERLKAVVATPSSWLGAPPSEVSALGAMALMKSFAGGAYFPVGGFKAMADALAKAFTDSGGTLVCGSEVIKINTGDGIVTSVDTETRAGIRAATVVCDADTRRTFLRLLGVENFTGGFLERVEGARLSHSGFAVHLGLAKEIEDKSLACGAVCVRPSYNRGDVYEAVAALDKYPEPGGIGFDLTVHSLLDPTLAPEGHSCLQILVPGVPYGFMDRWGVGTGGEKGRRYQQIKERYAEVVVESVRRTFPLLIESVKAYDVSTPITYELYTMASDGCWYDVAPLPKAALTRRLGPDTPIEGLYLAGSKSVLGGGIYGSAVNGALAADMILKGKLEKLFR
jgi:prolycopene isomerase